MIPPVCSIKDRKESYGIESETLEQIRSYLNVVIRLDSNDRKLLDRRQGIDGSLSARF